MKDIVISVCAGNSDTITTKPILGVKGEHLQSRFVIDFSDEFIDGTATIEYKKMSGAKGSLELTKGDNVYTGIVRNEMTDETPTIKCQLKVVGASTPNGIPIFKSKVFTLTVCDCVDDI